MQLHFNDLVRMHAIQMNTCIDDDFFELVLVPASAGFAFFSSLKKEMGNVRLGCRVPMTPAKRERLFYSFFALRVACG